MSRTTRWLVIIFGVALLVRLFAIFVLLPDHEYRPSHDAFQYNMLAESIMDGRGFGWPTGGNQHSFWALPEGPTSTRAPLYAAFLAGIYQVFGAENFTAARIAQCVMGALLCLILYGIGTLWRVPRVGLVAAAICAVYPPFIHFSYYGGPGRLLSEGLFMFLMVLALWEILKLVRNVDNRPAAILGGVLLGLATLARPVPTVFPGVLVVWALCAPRHDWSRWLKAVGWVTLAFVLTLAPWTIRNWQVHHRFVIVSTDQGHTFWLGNNTLARGGSVELHELFTPEEFDPGGKLTEWERYNKMTQQGLTFWREHPEMLPKLFLRKVLMMWNPYELTFNLWYGMLGVWTLLGIVVMWRGPPTQVHRLLIGSLLYATLITVATAGSTRVRYPWEPILILFAAAGITWTFEHARHKWVPGGVLAGLVAINVTLRLHSDTFLEFLRGAFDMFGLR